MADLHVEIDGREENPPLLLVHGFLSSNLQWLPNLETLREEFRMVSVELWGHGRSPAPREPEFYDIEAYLSRFEAIRRELGIESWFVCGQSFGAGIAMRYALSHPNALRGFFFTASGWRVGEVDQ